MSRIGVLLTLVMLAGCKHDEKRVEHPPENYPGAPQMAGQPAYYGSPEYAASPDGLPGYALKEEINPVEALPALGWTWVKVSVPIPRVYAIPVKEEKQQTIIVQQPAATIQPAGYAMPGMAPGPNPMEYAAMMRMLEQQQAAQQQSAQAAPSAQQRELEERAKKLEAQIDRLTESLQEE